MNNDWQRYLYLIILIVLVRHGLWCLVFVSVSICDNSANIRHGLEESSEHGSKFLPLNFNNFSSCFHKKVFFLIKICQICLSKNSSRWSKNIKHIKEEIQALGVLKGFKIWFKICPSRMTLRLNKIKFVMRSSKTFRRGRLHQINPQTEFLVGILIQRFYNVEIFFWNESWNLESNITVSLYNKDSFMMNLRTRIYFALSRKSIS